MSVETRNGLLWLGWLITGPTLWAIAFAAVYGLHGLGCALGWTSVAFGPVDLHRGAMGLVWLLFIALNAGLLLLAPRGTVRETRLPRLGLWIGLVATVYTLVPVVLTTSC